MLLVKMRNLSLSEITRVKVGINKSPNRAGIGGVVFGATEKRLLTITGNHEENPTMSMDCRQVRNLLHFRS